VSHPGVLIVGAGPTGLVLALWLTKLGVQVRIIDRTGGPGTTSRALAVHARTLELYGQLDLAEPVLAKGYAVPGARIWLQGRPAAHVPFAEIVSDMTPYGFLHIFPQDEHERLLIERLERFGVRVERSTELLDYRDEGDQITAHLRGPDGAESQVGASFIAGCDGVRSKVRDVMATGFQGGTYPQVFYVADVAGKGPAFNGELNIDFDQSDFLAVFPLANQGRIRLIGTIKEGEGKDAGKLTFSDVSDRAIRSLQLQVDKVNWFSTYHVHHRVADHFRLGRGFLLGDAAHIHTPVGGQGMNTGIGDAINLAWKLQAVLTGRATDKLLDTYESERRAFALRLVATTDRLFNLAAAEGPLAQIIRTRLAPIVLPQMVKLEAVREYIFRTVSQITLNYRGKGLDQGRAGDVHGGDRLPWVKIRRADNYETLKHIGWQIHVYGVPRPDLISWSQNRGVPLHAYRWGSALHTSGLRENALYLIRPDTYVAVSEASQNVGALEQFLDKTGIQPGKPGERS
jgi:2-polyprenyl-6-methoxyphenol hydroxylase-like FAD-dependent oxidoreductase